MTGRAPTEVLELDDAPGPADHIDAAINIIRASGLGIGYREAMRIVMEMADYSWHVSEEVSQTYPSTEWH